jgi:hypothetical protein
MDGDDERTAVVWPPLPYGEWRETLDTLHMWTQMVGKTKLGSARGSTSGGRSRSSSTPAG